MQERRFAGAEVLRSQQREFGELFVDYAQSGGERVSVDVVREETADVA